MLNRFALVLLFLLLQGGSLCAVPTIRLSEKRNEAFLTLGRDQSLSVQALQKKFVALLKQEASSLHQKTSFIYTSEPYTYPIEQYIAEAGSDPAQYCSRILDVLQFANTYLRMPETEAKSLGIYALYSSLKAVSYASAEDQGGLLYALGRAWLVPCMSYQETLSDPAIRSVFTDVLERYITFLRSQGRQDYPYACELFEKFIPRYHKDPSAQARCYYWLAWMYLDHGKRAKALVFARKIPKVPGMTEAHTRMSEWSKILKKQNK